MASIPAQRIQSIDILRGIVMIIMALDHVRDFFHISAMNADPLDPATTSIPLFFTRWITHFCAPLFVFLSGISAYLSSQRKSPRETTSFLVKRGAWLILVEVVLMTLILTFNPTYTVIFLAVIWVIGCSMILLGIFSRISFWMVMVTGLLLFFGHNFTDYLVVPKDGPAAAFWKVFFTAFGTVLPLGTNHIVLVLYAILPWTSVMFCGYATGYLFTEGFSAEKRRRILLALGVSLILLFVVLRLINGYGDPAPWKLFASQKQTFLSFLNTSKYPPSLVFLCMTLGPGLVALALLENVTSGFLRFVTVYGQVPFFYYVLHFFLIHTLCVIVFFAEGYSTSQIVDPNVPFLFRPMNFGYGLPVVYGIWGSLVLGLYFPCKWYSEYKKTHRKWWLSYL